MSVINRLTYTMRTLAGGAAIGLAVVASGPAQAQLDAGAALANLTSPDYLHRDMQVFSQGLNLDDGQRMIVDALYQDYLDRFEAGWAATQDKVNGLRDDLQNLDPKQDQSRILETIFAPFEEWRAQKSQLKARFESDVQAILGPAQSERWPMFQQQITREKSLHLGRLSGEALNLFHLVNDLRLSDRAYIDLQPVLDQYSNLLHESLMERNALMERGADEFIRGLRANGAVPRPRHVDEEIAARVRIRDINLRYLDVIAERLPEQHVERFRSRAQESAFPRVYRVLPAERMIKRALELEELDAETRKAIEEVRDQYFVEMNQLNQQLREMAIDFEPKQLRNQAEREDARHTGATVERLTDPARQMYTDRDERSRYYMELVQSMLPAEIAKTFPEGASRADVQQQRRARAASRNNAKQQANEDRSQPTRPQVGGATGGGTGGGGRGGK